MAETNFLNVIAVHLTADTAAPTTVSKGGNIAAATWTTDGFSTIRSRNLNSDDGDLADANITLDMEKIIQSVKPPLAHAAQDHTLFGKTIESFDFECFDFGLVFVAVVWRFNEGQFRVRPD